MSIKTVDETKIYFTEADTRQALQNYALLNGIKISIAGYDPYSHSSDVLMRQGDKEFLVVKQRGAKFDSPGMSGASKEAQRKQAPVKAALIKIPPSNLNNGPRPQDTAPKKPGM